MTRVIALVLAGILAIVFAAPATAWEFSIRGEYEYRFRYVGDTGPMDLFGNRKLQGKGGGDLSIVGLAGPNIYGSGAFETITNFNPQVNKPTSNLLFNLGSSFVGITGQMAIIRGGYAQSASDARWNDARLTLYPEIRVNSAIKVWGAYNLGGYRNKYNMTAGGQGVPPFERYYMFQTSMNAYDTASVGSWEQFRVTAQLPWGILSLGAKDFPLGTGATFANNTRADMLLLVVPYGPLRFLGAVWLAQSRYLDAWRTSPAGENKNTGFYGGVVTYDNGPLSVGIGTLYRSFHGDEVSEVGERQDDITLVNIIYFKHNDGRFFANAEYAWANVDRHRWGPTTPGTGIPNPGDDVFGTRQTLFIESYHFFAEIGAIAGPVKLSLMYALSSGPVLNNQNRLRTAYNPFFFAGANPKIYTPFPINYQALEPYELLMFNTYAGGNNGGWNLMDVTFVADDHGMLSDGYAFAARLDYAVAANLNVWAAYIWAHRLERAGVFFGQYNSKGHLATNIEVGHFGENADRASVPPPPNPFFTPPGLFSERGYVSNGLIGWEMNLGIDWKLLEGMTAKLRYAYWQPGEYFREAYQATNLLTSGPVPVVNPNAVLQSRDAIQAFQWSLLIDF